MTDRLRDALRHQAQACQDLGSPFMHQLMMLLADRLQPDSDLTRRMFDWPGDLGPSAASVPLRLAGALHALARQGRKGLDAVYPPNTVSDDVLWNAVSTALATEGVFIDAFIDNAPQTNEVRRASTLIAAGHWLTKAYGLPIELYELGASAGLNLMWDRFELSIGDQAFGQIGSPLSLSPNWSGPLPERVDPQVVGRFGVDLAPLDPLADQDRLLAYLWPDQPHRLHLTQAAIELASSAVDQADAVTWLADRLAPKSGTLQMVYSTIAWQYFPADAQAKGTAMIEDAGRQATPDAPIAWFTMEADGKARGAALTLRLWPGDLRFDMGRADFHGRWIDWSPPDIGLPIDG